ncbi:MAG: DASS family sodium-coupled anion symporter [Planctomycetes bacterium]|nr:DASS family sodium-coupled anion symporter [Planctomycetota bacterium]
MALKDSQKKTESKLSNAEIIAWIGRIGGPILSIAIYLLLPGDISQMTAEARATASIGVLMAIWWMTEALPLPVTALLPLILFPLAGVFPDPTKGSQIQQAASPFANRFIFLFMGGFMIALAIEKWNLHRRIALLTVLAVGTKPARMIAGFMIATAILSMWISNTATTVMMLPIGLSVITLVKDRFGSASDQNKPPEDPSENMAQDLSQFGICLMLGIAYAASIGGVGTLVGTPPNVFFASFMDEQYGITLGFGTWMGFALPLVVIFLFLAWLILTKVVFPVKIKQIPGGKELIRQELRKLGPMSQGEWTVLVVFLLTASAWVLRGPLTTKWDWLIEQVPAITRLDDTIIALIGALLLFIIPVDIKNFQFALDWQTARRLPWGMLLLFGGGLSLAAAVTASGLDKWIGQLLSELDGLSPIILIILVTAVVIFLTELTSNIATATTFLPILGGVALQFGIDPLMLLAPAALAASCAFMLPVATPPNAIVFGSGYIQIGQMIKAGLWLNIIGLILIPLFMYTLGAWILSVTL